METSHTNKCAQVCKMGLKAGLTIDRLELGRMELENGERRWELGGEKTGESSCTKEKRDIPEIILF